MVLQVSKSTGHVKTSLVAIKYIFIFIFLSFYLIGLSQTNQSDSISLYKAYPFIIKDSPSPLFTMKFVNQNYLSSYRLWSNFVDKNLSERSGNLVKTASLLFLLPLTHEEGHRSILTSENIGSISAPYFNIRGAAYVKGVSDNTLIHLRDNNLPYYIRIHTAGLESDYMLTIREETLISLDLESIKNLKHEYLFRKFQLISYYLTGLVKYDPNIKEENNESKRDIVGHDIYGAIRHLHRPTMNFYRYTRFDSLTREEKKYTQRCGWLSLFNLVSPVIFGKSNFSLNQNVKYNFSLGYTMSPFGDFLDQNIWVKYREKLNLQFYIREFSNKNNLFPAFGTSIIQYPIKNYKFLLDVSLNVWNQPEKLNFFTNNDFWGGAVDVNLKYPVLFLKNSHKIKALSLDLGIIYKTKGFLPEETVMNEHFGVRFGTSIYLDN